VEEIGTVEGGGEENKERRGKEGKKGKKMSEGERRKWNKKG
jgi:hypothetical protein